MSTAKLIRSRTQPVQAGHSPCRTIVRSMLLVLGAVGAGWAQDADAETPFATVTTDATGLIGTSMVTNRGSVKFTVEFNRSLFSTYLLNNAITADGTTTAMPTFAQLYGNLFTITGGANTTNTVKQLTGNKFEVTVTPVADAATASLAIAAGAWANVADAAKLNEALAAVSVKNFLLAGVPPSYTIAIPNYSGFLNNPSLTGNVAFNTTSTTSGDNPNGARVSLTARTVNSSGTLVPSLAGTAVANGSSGVAAAWNYAPATAPDNGRYYFSATATDAAGNAIAGTPNTTVYVWKQPVVSEVKQLTSFIDFTNNMPVASTTPEFKGFAGIDDGDAKIGADNNVVVTIDIFKGAIVAADNGLPYGDVFSNDNDDRNDVKAIDSVTLDRTNGKLTADSDGTPGAKGTPFLLSASDYLLAGVSTNLAAGTYTLRVNTKIVDSTGAVESSINSIDTVQTFQVQTTVPTAPTLTVASTRPDHRAKVTVSSWPAGVANPVAYGTSTLGDSTTIKMQISDRAVVSTSMVGTNNDVTLTSVSTDDRGADVTLTLVDPNAVSAALAVTVDGTAISVSLATDGSSAITTTATQLVAALSGNTAAAALVTAAVKAGDSGAGLVTALAPIALERTFKPIAGKVYYSGGVYTWYADAALPDGEYRYRATVTDLAGATSDYTSVIPAVTGAAHIIATPTPVIAITGITTGTPGVGTVPGTPVPVGGTPAPDYQYLLSVRRPVFKMSSNTPTGNTLTADTKGDLVVYMVSRGTTGDLFDTTTDLIAGNIVPGTYTYVGAGNATWTPTDPLPVGSYSLCAVWVDQDTLNTTSTVDDEAGAGGLNKSSVPSNIFNFRLLSVVDKPEITKVYDAGVDGVNGSGVGDDIEKLDTSSSTTVSVSSGKVVLKGRGNPGATLRVFRNGLLQPTITIATPGDGVWFYPFTGETATTASALPAGTNKITVQQVDLCGTSSVVTTTSINIVVDASVPAVPVVSFPTANSVIADTTPLFKGTALANSTLYVDVSTVGAAGTDDQSVLVSPTGTWELQLANAKALTTDTKYYGTVAEAAAITFRVKSPAGVFSPYSAAHKLEVKTPVMKVDLEPLAKGTATGVSVVTTSTGAAGSTVYAAGATILKMVATGAGTLLTGDEIVLGGNTYIVAAGNSIPTTGTANVTLRSGLKAKIVKDDVVGVTINANPNAPVSKGNANTVTTSLPSILLTATLKDGSGNPLPSVLATAFTKSSVQCVNGTVTSVTKGTGLPGQQATNVWTIAVTPSTTPTTSPAGELQVWIPDGAFANAPGKYVDDITVNQATPGAWYSSPPTVKITNGGGSEATATVSLKDGAVVGLSILNGGSGYVGAPAVTIAAPGTGTTAEATATVVNGVVTGLVVTKSGKGYTSAPAVTIAAPASGITAKASASIANGVLDLFTMTNKGWGFTTAPTVSITPPAGAGAKGTATASSPTAVTVAVSAAGTGYSQANPPMVRISAGEGATAKAIVSGGKITSITRLTGGQYYSQVPTVTITDSGGGTGATATATISGGVVTGIVPNAATNHTGYTANTVVTITPSASGATASATVGADGKVSAISVAGTMAGYTAAPYVIITTGSGGSATPALLDGALVFNKLSDSNREGAETPNDNADNEETVADGIKDNEKYTLNINRSAPTVTWGWATSQPVDSTSQLRPVIEEDGSTYDSDDDTKGAFFVNQQATAADTTFTVRAKFSPPLAELLVPTDLNLVGCDLDPTFGTAGIKPVNADGTTDADGTYERFDIKIKRGVKTGTVMSLTVKAGIALSKTTPAIANVVSPIFTATLVSQTTTKPIITSPIGSAAPEKGSKVPSYTCTITFPNNVRACLPENLTVTNGVITKWAGSGKVFTFTLTPGEGQVAVKYENTASNKIYDVAGNEVASSDEFTRLCDSTQPVISQVSSPIFRKMNTATGASAPAATATLKVIGVAIANGGSGYSAGDVLTLNGAGGTGATATVASVDGGGAITGVTLTAGGSGYTANTGITVTDVGAGTGATATFTMGVGAITVTQGGLGFGGLPVISLDGGAGTGAVVSTTAVNASGTITEISVDQAGTGYTSAPTLTIHNSIKPMDGSTQVNRFPVRVTFTEPLAAFPTGSVVTSVSGLAANAVVTIDAPKWMIDAAVAAGKAKPVGPQVVTGTGGAVYEFDIVVPTALTAAGEHNVRLVVPSQGVTDGAINASQASQVFTFTYDMVNGMPFEVKTSPVYSNG